MAVQRLSIVDARAVIAAAKKPKRQKYGAKGTRVDGHYFPSLLEARRYGVLRMLERGGHIRDLQLQPRFPLEVHGVVVGEYRADFSYKEPQGQPAARRQWVTVVEDAKGMVLPLYKLKRALFLVLNPSFDFREITR